VRSRSTPAPFDRYAAAFFGGRPRRRGALAAPAAFFGGRPRRRGIAPLAFFGGRPRRLPVPLPGGRPRRFGAGATDMYASIALFIRSSSWMRAVIPVSSRLMRWSCVLSSEFFRGRPRGIRSSPSAH
jgi:hypothetical protein